MSYPPLSREALQVLELLPGWRFRNESIAGAAVETVASASAHVATEAAVGAAASVALMLPKLSEPGRKLWRQIAHAMALRGYDPACLASAFEINPLNERAISEWMAAQKPRRVLVFGASLAQVVQKQAAQKEGLQVVSLPGPDEMIENPELKRTAWQLICSSASVFVDAD